MSLPRFQIGVVAAALSPDARQAAAQAAQAGFDGLLFDAAKRELDLPGLSLTGRQDFLKMLAHQNQRLIGLRAGSGTTGLAGADADKLLSRWDRVLETAAGLRSPLVCLDVGPLPKSPQAVLTELGRRADRYGVMIALGSDLDSLQSMHSALESVDCPWFGLNLDPVSLLADAWSEGEVFTRLGPLIRLVRGRDAMVGENQRTRPVVIGQGSVQWEEQMSLLDEAGFQGWITIDPMQLLNPRDAAMAGLKYLRQIESAEG